MENILMSLLEKNTELIGGIVAYMLWEFYVGRNKNWKSNSTIELVLRVINTATSKLIGDVAKAERAESTTQLKDADVAAGQIKEGE